MSRHTGPTASTISKTIGKRFGRLIVLELLPTPLYEKTRAKCICDCGKETITTTNCLLTGHTKSCGCLQPETNVNRLTIHGMSNSVEFKTWQWMMDRCTNPKNRAYKHYGKRGITVCSEWQAPCGLGFMTFFSEMGKRPVGLSIHRVDNDLGYCMENCIWTDRRGHGAHKQHSHFMWLNGVRRTLTEWSRLLGIRNATIQTRLENGWTDEEALTIPVRPHKPYSNFKTLPTHVKA